MAIVKTLIGNIKGPKGEKGDKGDTGAKGDKGATGQRGSRWTQGTKITGTSTTATIFSNSGISDALVNDNYLNTSTGNTYRCTVAGNASTAKWVYSGNIKGPKGDTGAKGDKGDTGATGPKGPQGEYAAVDSALSSTSTNPIQNKTVYEEFEKKLNSDVDSKDLTTTFTSQDSTNVTQWTDVGVLQSGEKHSSMFQKISTMFKNIRYLYHMLGTADISALGEGADIGTVTGALSKLNSDCTNIEMKEIIVPDEYKNKISFRDDFEKYVFKCGKICIANIMFDLSEDITFPTNNSWNTFLSLPFEVCYGGILYFFQISRIDDNTAIYALAPSTDITFYSGTTIKSGMYYFHVTYFTN